MINLISNDSTVRAILSIVIVVGTVLIYGFQGSIPEGLLAIVSAIIGYYFRQAQDTISNQRRIDNGIEY